MASVVKSTDNATATETEKIAIIHWVNFIILLPQPPEKLNTLTDSGFCPDTRLGGASTRIWRLLVHCPKQAARQRRLPTIR